MYKIYLIAALLSSPIVFSKPLKLKCAKGLFSISGAPQYAIKSAKIDINRDYQEADFKFVLKNYTDSYVFKIEKNVQVNEMETIFYGLINDQVGDLKSEKAFVRLQKISHHLYNLQFLFDEIENQYGEILYLRKYSLQCNSLNLRNIIISSDKF